MRVERVGVDAVKNRLETIKRKIQEASGATPPSKSALEDHDSLVASQIAEEELRKRRRKEEAASKKKEQEAAELETMDPEIAAMMGFGSFGSSSKR